MTAQVGPAEPFLQDCLLEPQDPLWLVSRDFHFCHEAGERSPKELVGHTPHWKTVPPSEAARSEQAA